MIIIIESISAVFFFLGIIALKKKYLAANNKLKYILGLIFISFCINILISITDVIEWSNLLNKPIVEGLEEYLTPLFAIFWFYICIKLNQLIKNKNVNKK